MAEVGPEEHFIAKVVDPAVDNFKFLQVIAILMLAIGLKGEAGLAYVFKSVPVY